MSHTCHFCYVYRHIWPQIYITGLRALGVNILSLTLFRMTSFSTIMQTVITHGSCYLLYIQLQHFLVNIQKFLPRTELYPSKEKMLRIVIWHLFWGDFSQNEKLSEIKPPLIKHHMLLL